VRNAHAYENSYFFNIGNEENLEPESGLSIGATIGIVVAIILFKLMVVACAMYLM
jgi:hypothetical protein